MIETPSEIEELLHKDKHSLTHTELEKIITYREQKAEELLKSENILDYVEELLDSEITGEEYNKLVLFLLCLVKTEEIYVRGESAIGKTKLVNSILKFFPKHQIKKLGMLSEMAPKYVDWTNVKILHIQEYLGNSETQDMMFRLMSRDDDGMTFAVTKRDKQTGEFVVQEGHIPHMCVIFTTTKFQINPENATRSWMISGDASEEQTGNIVNFKKLRYTRPWLVKDYSFEKEVLKTALLALEDYPVLLPFLDALKVPTKDVRMRRDYDKMVKLTEAITLLHQYNRPKITINGVNYLVSKVEDLEAAIELSGEIFRQTTSGLLPYHLKVYEHLLDVTLTAMNSENIKDRNEIEGVTAKDVAKATGYSQKWTYEICESLVTMGYAHKEKIVARGNPNAYTATTKPLSCIKIDDEKVEEIWGDWLKHLPEEVEKEKLFTIHPKHRREIIKPKPQQPSLDEKSSRLRGHYTDHEDISADKEKKEEDTLEGLFLFAGGDKTTVEKVIDYVSLKQPVNLVTVCQAVKVKKEVVESLVLQGWLFLDSEGRLCKK